MNKDLQLKFIEDNYPAKTNHISNRKMRHSFFSKIETELQAYLLGFYAADGSIDEKRKTFRTEVLIRDKEIIDLLQESISPDARVYTHPARYLTGRNGKRIHTNGSIGIDITSAQLCTDLVKCGIGYRKSYTDFEIPECIPDNLVKHFIRGFFDGDGSITCGVYLDSNKPNPRFRMHVFIDSKKKLILESIQKHLDKKNINLKIIYLKRDDMWRLNSAGITTSKNFLNYLYLDANFYLSRKYNTYYYYVNTEVTTIIELYRNALKVSVKESNNPSTSPEHPNKDENVC